MKTTKKKAATKTVARKRSGRAMLAEPINVKARLRQALDTSLKADAATRARVAADIEAKRDAFDTPPPAPVAPPVYSQAWRAGIDWVAAGKKAYETRMRNLAARAATGGAPLPTPARPRPASKPFGGDASEADYVTRLTAAITRTVEKGQEDRIAAIIGKDMGGGWLVVATDGWRALVRKATPADTLVPIGTVLVTKAGRAKFGLTLTPAVEHAIALARIGVDKKAPAITLTLDRKTKMLTITGAHLVGRPAGPITAPFEPPLPKDAPTTLTCNARFLADAMGRGGRLGWDIPKARKGTTLRPPYVVEVSDQVRYVLMPILGAK